MAEENILTKTNYYNTMVMQLMMEENRRVQYIFLFFTQKETAWWIFLSYMEDKVLSSPLVSKEVQNNIYML